MILSCDIVDLCCEWAGAGWDWVPGTGSPYCPPLLHFPANLKHNKRPFYPQNKLTITPHFFTQIRKIQREKALILVGKGGEDGVG